MGLVLLLDRCELAARACLSAAGIGEKSGPFNAGVGACIKNPVWWEPCSYGSNG
jgi:hypothetical protein